MTTNRLDLAYNTLFSSRNKPGAFFRLASILQEFALIESRAAKFDSKSLTWEMRRERGVQLYNNTKRFLEQHSAALTPEEKGIIFKGYIHAWFTTRCLLETEDIENAYKHSIYSFGKDSTYFCPGKDSTYFMPVLIGFNLKDASLKDIYYPDLTFFAVNLENADLSGTTFAMARFEECRLIGIKTNKTNLNKTKFIKSNLQDADLQGARLCNAYFNECDVTNVIFDKRADIGFLFCVGRGSVIRKDVIESGRQMVVR